MASEIKVNTIKKASGSSITVGESGDTVTLASGAVVSGGFKDIQWQSVITADGSTNTTAEAGKGYIIDSSSATHTINLPASPSAGDTISIKDYAGTFGTNNVTVGRNGSNMGGGATDYIASTNFLTITLVYADSTQGWISVSDNTTNVGPTFVEATGGTETTSGDFKIHSFTSSGCFTVSSLSSLSGSNEVSYIVAGGGAGGGRNAGGGGGAGGFRENRASNDSYTVSPLNGSSPITVTATTYPITVGAGGSGAPAPSGGATSGSDSTFSTITSSGGGFGGSRSPAPQANGAGGGSGGGNAGDQGPGNGSGNVPPVSPPQGNQGGASGSGDTGAGGGGATAAGASSDPGGPATPGGAGASTSITGSSVQYAGGGGGGGYPCGSRLSGNGGGSGGGCGADSPDNPGGQAVAGTSNKSTGGGGGSNQSPAYGGSAGGSGVVIIRYKYQ